jgi:arylsulfatase A-like enzyme
MRTFLFLCVLCVLCGSTPPSSVAKSPPNVLFIAIDDLNDWVGCLGGHPQAITPHIDRLAARGVNFTNAHCQAPICQPSRTSLLTGTYPWANGVYDIEQNMRDAPLVRNAVTIPEYFSAHGYTTLAAGNIYHRTSDEEGMWTDKGPRFGWNWMRDRIGSKCISGLPEPSIFDFGPVPFEDGEMNDMRVEPPPSRGCGCGEGEG